MRTPNGEPFAQQYRPELITMVNILEHEARGSNGQILQRTEPESIITSFTGHLPRVGEMIYLTRDTEDRSLLSGGMLVLEVVDVVHWAREVEPGQTVFHDNVKDWVDVTLTCRRSSATAEVKKAQP